MPRGPLPPSRYWGICLCIDCGIFRRIVARCCRREARAEWHTRWKQKKGHAKHCLCVTVHAHQGMAIDPKRGLILRSNVFEQFHPHFQLPAKMIIICQGAPCYFCLSCFRLSLPFPLFSTYLYLFIYLFQAASSAVCFIWCYDVSSSRLNDNDKLCCSLKVLNWIKEGGGLRLQVA